MNIILFYVLVIILATLPIYSTPFLEYIGVGYDNFTTMQYTIYFFTLLITLVWIFNLKEDTVNKISKQFEFFSIVSLFAIFILVVLQVFYRFVLSSPLPWPEEASRVLFIYGVFLACVTLTKNKEHISIDITTILKLNDKGKVSLGLLSLALTLTSSLVISSGALIIIPNLDGITLPATELPISLMMYPVYLGFTWISVFYFHELFQKIKNKHIER